MYDCSPSALSKTCDHGINTAMNALNGIVDLYVWDFYDDISELAAYRKQAASRFLNGVANHSGRYH